MNARRILVREDLCSGCRACEVACVARHEGSFGTAAARIRVTKIESLGVDHPHVCRHCSHAPCVDACPVGALYKDGTTGAILLVSDDCLGCSACADACPFGVVTLHPETGLALICDLCGGDPACVKRCATGAILYADVEAGSRAKRRALTITARDRAEKG
jgi:carbon-monoxide dehydrogenase iron sulfur subunit